MKTEIFFSSSEYKFNINFDNHLKPSQYLNYWFYNRGEIKMKGKKDSMFSFCNIQYSQNTLKAQ